MRTVRDIARRIGVSAREVPPGGARGMPPSPSSADHRALWARKADANPTLEAPGRRPPPPPGERPGDRPPARSAGSRLLGQLAELPLLVLLAFVIAVLIKTFLVQAFFIPSTSMLPTLQEGDRVLVEKLSYHVRDPRPQDVVVFAKSVFGVRTPELPWYLDARNFLRELLGLPTGVEQDYIKRIVAVGGDTIRYAGNPRQLTVNGAEIEEDYVRGGRDRFSPTLTANDCKRLDMERRDGGCVVPEGRVFVMGDNRQDSEDSRVIGPVAVDKIVGHAFVVIWPPADISGL